LNSFFQKLFRDFDEFCTFVSLIPIITTNEESWIPELHFQVFWQKKKFLWTKSFYWIKTHKNQIFSKPSSSKSQNLLKIIPFKENRKYQKNYRKHFEVKNWSIFSATTWRVFRHNIVKLIHSPLSSEFNMLQMLKTICF